VWCVETIMISNVAAVQFQMNARVFCGLD
jgi:hypothetical protein